MMEISVSLWVSLRLLLFISVFALYWLTRVGRSISYLVSVPLRKGYRGLEYSCSFVRLYLFLFAFLIICIKSWFLSASFLHFWLFTLKLFVFVDCFVTQINQFLLNNIFNVCNVYNCPLSKRNSLKHMCKWNRGINFCIVGTNFKKFTSSGTIIFWTIALFIKFALSI